MYINKRLHLHRLLSMMTNVRLPDNLGFITKLFVLLLLGFWKICKHILQLSLSIKLNYQLLINLFILRHRDMESQRHSHLATVWYVILPAGPRAGGGNLLNPRTGSIVDVPTSRVVFYRGSLDQWSVFHKISPEQGTT